MKLAIKKTNKIGAIIIILIVLAVLIGGGVFALTHVHKSTSQPAPATGSGSTSDNSPSSNTKSQYDGPSDSKSVNDTNNSNPSTQSSKSVEVLITDAHQYGSVVEVRAYANAYENGTCTYTFTKGTSVITKQTTATTGASTTSCATLDTPVSEFTSGTWSVKVTYSSQSNDYTGSSASQSIIVQ